MNSNGQCTVTRERGRVRCPHVAVGVVVMECPHEHVVDDAMCDYHVNRLLGELLWLNCSDCAHPNETPACKLRYVRMEIPR